MLDKSSTLWYIISTLLVNVLTNYGGKQVWLSTELVIRNSCGAKES